MKNTLLNKITRNQIAVEKVVANSLQRSLRDQVSQLNTNNTKHTKQWQDYGYPNRVSFDDLYRMWERFGIAKAGVELPVDYGWMDDPTIKEGSEEEAAKDETQWEKDTAKLFKEQKLFKKLKGVDRRNRIGEYAAFIVQIRSDDVDETDWSKPLSGVTTDKILRFIPVTQGQLIANDKTPSTDERYPLPNFYTLLNYGDESSQDNNSGERDSVTIHHTRVIIFAEGADDNTLNGIPVNRSGYNALLDLEKTSGAGAEGFWKSVSQKLVLSSQSGSSPSLQEQDNITQSINNAVDGLDASMMIGGMDIAPLGTTLPSNYKDPFMNSLNVYAASVGIPATVLIGAQTGRLASDEDGKHLAKMVNSRRNDWQTEMIESVIEWLNYHLTDYNAPEEYSVKWSDMLESSLSEKIENADKLANAAQKLNAARMQGETAVTEAEFRETAGLPTKKEEEQLDMFGETDETGLNNE